ncbi:MAG: DMT family transporter [Candidatus Heimdallarchaeota archaeon]
MSLVLYWLGVLMAIISGIANNYGTVLQKKVVNEIKDNSKFFKSLIKNRLWLIGLVLQLGIGAIFFLIAQMFIGPTLIPGLMAAGLIILAIGSVKIVGEQLKASEIIGIVLMITAITFIGFSNMEIDVTSQNFLEFELFFRIMIFTIIIYILAAIFYILQMKNISKGISLAVYSGFQFVLSNFWISPVMGVIVHLFDGTAQLLEIIIFIIAIFILSTTNIFGITSIQKAFREGQASNLIPIQQVPIQISPPFYYIAVFLLPIQDILSLFFLTIGIVLVIISSFLLGKRQAQIEKIK